MTLGKMIMPTLLLLATSTISAMPIAENGNLTEEQSSAIRQQIGLDLSMPDYKTKKLDARIIGDRLAQMLRMLNNTQSHLYHSYLSRIAAEQAPSLRYLRIDEVKVERIRKSGNNLEIQIAISFDKSTKGQKSYDLLIHFTDGVSDSPTANDLFCYLSRYVKTDADAHKEAAR